MAELDEGGFSDVDSPSTTDPPAPSPALGMAKGDERRIKWPMARLIPKIYSAEIEPQKDGSLANWLKDEKIQRRNASVPVFPRSFDPTDLQRRIVQSRSTWQPIDSIENGSRNEETRRRIILRIGYRSNNVSNNVSFEVHEDEESRRNALNRI